MAVFIICEFDPFHYGHEYLISEARRLRPGEPVICVMSGSFVQRGRPAVYDGYARAACAVEGGADLVLSLPFPWSASSAEFFAGGAVSIISGLCREGDTLVFGSGCGDRRRLSLAADAVSSPDFERALKERVGSLREPYAEARRKLSGDPELLSCPNDVLGVEYVRALRKLCPGTDFEPVLRRADFESSTEIKASSDMLSRLPSYCRDILSREGEPADIRFAGHLILSHLRESPYAGAADGENGLIGRLHRAACGARDIDGLFAGAASPQFTNARIRRAALFSYLGVCRSDLKKKPGFTVVLAGNAAGSDYLSKTKKTRSVAVITKPSRAGKLPDETKKQYDLQCRADRLYCLCFAQAREAAYFLKAVPYFKT